MSFNHEECELLRVTNKRQPTTTSYIMSEHTHKEADDKKYLDIAINNKLKWNKHVQTICTMANNTLIFLRRNSSYASPTAMIKELGWQSLTDQRAKAKAVTIYKFQNNMIAIPQNLFQ